MKNYTLEQIYLQIDYCLENYFLMTNAGLYPLVKITDKGKLKLALNETIMAK
jgi:hypothetical protein